MKVYYLITDNGDGSGSVQFFKDERLAKSLVDDEDQLGVFYPNEGTVGSFEIPDGDNTIRFYDERYR